MISRSKHRDSLVHAHCHAQESQALGWVGCVSHTSLSDLRSGRRLTLGAGSCPARRLFSRTHPPSPFMGSPYNSTVIAPAARRGPPGEDAVLGVRAANPPHQLRARTRALLRSPKLRPEAYDAARAALLRAVLALCLPFCGAFDASRELGGGLRPGTLSFLYLCPRFIKTP